MSTKGTLFTQYILTIFDIEFVTLIYISYENVILFLKICSTSN